MPQTLFTQEKAEKLEALNRMHIGWLNMFEVGCQMHSPDIQQTNAAFERAKDMGMLTMGAS